MAPQGILPFLKGRSGHRRVSAGPGGQCWLPMISDILIYRAQALPEPQLNRTSCPGSHLLPFYSSFNCFTSRVAATPKQSPPWLHFLSNQSTKQPSPCSDEAEVREHRSGEGLGNPTLPREQEAASSLAREACGVWGPGLWGL